MPLPTRLLTAGALATVVALAPATAYAQTGSTPHQAGQYAAGYLARTIAANGGHLDNPASFGGGVDYASTANAVLSLVANGVGADAAKQAAAYLAAHVDTYAKDSKGKDKPGALGVLILVAHATGADPHAFGGTDLVTRLQATEGAFTPPGGSSPTAGLFGAQDPTYDGAYRQGLAVLALTAAGVAPDSAALQWLTGQQCADGGWSAYRADTTKPCAASGEDSNSTALAMQALKASHAAAATDPIGYLHGIQAADGGFPYMPGSGSDANSTGLVVQALLASGQEPSTWVKTGGTPWSALTHLQLGCSWAVGTRGALDYQAEKPLKPNDNATAQAAMALAGAPLPVAAATLSAAVPTLSCPATPAPAATTAATPAATSAPSTTVSAGKTLAVTGSNDGALAVLGGALLLVGGALVTVGRRKRA